MNPHLPALISALILSACATNTPSPAGTDKDQAGASTSAAPVELAAPPNYFGHCKIADTRSAGEATLVLRPLSVERSENFSSNFGVVLTDGEGNFVYRVVASMASDPLRITGAIQAFYLSEDPGKNAINAIESFTPPLDGRVRVHLWWDDTGLVRVTLNGIDLGRARFAQAHRNWKLFVTGMAMSVQGTGIDFSDCKN